VNWFLWWKCLDCLDWNGFFGVQTVDIVGWILQHLIYWQGQCVCDTLFFCFFQICEEGGLVIIHKRRRQSQIWLLVRQESKKQLWFLLYFGNIFQNEFQNYFLIMRQHVPSFFPEKGPSYHWQFDFFCHPKTKTKQNKTKNTGFCVSHKHPLGLH